MEPRTGALQTTKPYTLFFVHIPKTAGLTFQNVLAGVYENTCYCTVYPSWEDAKGLINSFAWNGRLRAMAGHFPYGLHREADVQALIESEVRYTAFLRNPVDRVVSHYNYVLNSPHPMHRDIVARHPTLESFLAHPWGRDLQTYFASGWKHADVQRAPAEATRAAIEILRDHFEVVGLTERFDESLILLAEALGWELPTYISTNRSSESARRIRAEELAPSLIARIEEANRCDMALYEYAQSLFSERCSATPSFQTKLTAYQSRLTSRQPAAQSQ